LRFIRDILANMTNTLFFLMRNFNIGGGEKFTVSLMNNLDRTLFKIVVIVLDDVGPLKKELANDIKVISLNSLQGNALEFLPKLTYISTKLKNLIEVYKPDVVISTNWFLNLVSSLITNCIHKSNARLLLINHTPVRDLLFRSTFYNMLVPVKVIITRILFNRADKIVAITDSMSYDLKQFLKLPSDNIATIYNGISVESITSLAKQHCYFSHDNKPYIVSVGRLEYVKGFDLLIQAFASIASKLPHYLFIIGAGSQRSNLEKMVEGFKLKKRIIFLGELVNPCPVMKQADFIVQSSRWEAFPYVILEALTLEVPIIATDCDGPKKILRNGDYGVLVPQNDISQLSKAMLHFAEEPVLRDSYRAKSLSRALDFSFDTMIHKYEKLLLVLHNCLEAP